VYKAWPSKIFFLLVSALAVSNAQAKGQQGLPVQASAASSKVLPGYVSNKAVTPESEKNTAVTTSATATAIDHRGYAAGDFLVTTTSLIEGYSILDYKGLVEGAAVRVPTWSEDAAAGSQEVYGGSITAYAQLCEEARIQAFNTLVDRAKKLGANAVIGIHFDSQVMPLDKGKFASGVVCVGTAVIAKRKQSY